MPAGGGMKVLKVGIMGIPDLQKRGKRPAVSPGREEVWPAPGAGQTSSTKIWGGVQQVLLLPEKKRGTHTDG